LRSQARLADPPQLGRSARKNHLAKRQREAQDGGAVAQNGADNRRSYNMQIRKVLSLVGPNIWANYPVLEAWIDLGDFDTKPSNTLPGFNECLMAWLPSMIEHRCSEGVRGGFFSRMRDGTWLGHVLEHVTLELQTLAHLPVGFGRTRETSKRGVYRVVVECHDHAFGEACLRTARELLLAAVDNRAFDVPAQLRRLRELADKHCLGPSTQAIVTAAKARGIPFLRLSQGNLVQLGYAQTQRRIWAAETAKTGALAEAIAQDKELTRQLLHAVGVPMPAGRSVQNRADAWAAAEDLGLPVVVKPQDANHGRGVSIRLEDRDAVERAFDIAAREGSAVLVEKFIAGTQHRVLVVGDKAIAASGGEAEQVIADGVRTVEELIEVANQDPERGEDSAQPLTTLVLDEISVELLRQQGLEKTSVPPPGRKVTIHYNGDLTVDETERLHPDIASSCVIAAQTVGLDVAGIDVIAEDIARPLEEQSGAIIEVNASPGLVMHIKPLAGKPRPVGEAILNHLFAPGESGRVPLVAVSGTNGKTYVTTMVAAMLAAAGRNVGCASSTGLGVGNRVLANQDATNAACARRLLQNPFVDAIVLETDEIQVVRQGLAFDRCQVAVVTNLGSGDHMGEQYVDDRTLIAKAIRAPMDVVLPDGCAALNACDPEVAAMAEKCRGRILYFASQGMPDLLRAHVDKGEEAVYVADDQIVSAHKGQITRIVPLGVLATQPFGSAPFFVEDVVAAAAGGVALGLTAHAIRSGIETSLQQAGVAAYQEGTRLLVLTPISNRSALAAWVELLRREFPERIRHAVLEVPSDWRPDDSAEMGRLLGETFASLCLVAPRDDGTTIENLCRIIQHPVLRREASFSDAIDRITSASGSSDLIFVGPSMRSGFDLANSYLRKGNMVRLDQKGLAAMSTRR
jgi:cyanophycin synthetase